MQNRKRRNANNDARTDGFLDRKHDQKYGHKYERFNPTDNVTKPKKKRKQQRNISLRNNFSYEDLYDATIPSNLTAIETGEWIAKTLGDIDTVNFLVFLKNITVFRFRLKTLWQRLGLTKAQNCSI